MEDDKPKEDALKKNTIDFNELILKYKRENFKSVHMVHHEFLYSCVHPKDDDHVLCLEKNIYPAHQ